MAIMTVVGARPQLIKAAVTSEALRAAGVEEAIVHTGQHYDANMSEVFLDELRIADPIATFDVRESQHGAQTAAIMARLEPLVLTHRPRAMLVFGDTNSTLAAALVAAKLHVPVLHVESGLRSFNERMPEEINRVLTDRVATRLYAPSDTAVANLRAEGAAPERIVCTGDVMLDVFERTARGLRGRDVTERPRHVNSRPRILFTSHRAENVDDPTRLETIVAALERIAREADVLWPLHPRTAKMLEREGLDARVRAAGLRLETPFGYLRMVRELLDCDVVCTDSGGVQKEAFFAARPCVTIRDETEWTELVDGGWNVLCPVESAAEIARTVLGRVGRLGRDIHPYGRGQASTAVAADVAALLGERA